MRGATIDRLLRSPRVAGLREHHGAVMEAKAEWEPIVARGIDCAPEAGRRTRAGDAGA